MFYCAQYDDKGRVFSVSQLSSKMVEIPSNDEKLVGTFYNETDKTFHGFNIALTVDKASITADGLDTAIVTAKVTDYTGVVATSFTDPILFSINGIKSSVVPANGVATLVIKSATVGVQDIKTENVGYVMNNGSIRVDAV